MECILHVGVHKTGTTAIQEAFAGYDDGSLAYADLGTSNHSIPFKTLFSDSMNFHWRAMGEPLVAVRDAFHSSLEAALERRPPRILFSAESISILPLDGMQRMRAHLARHCDSFRVIMFVRDPASWTASSVQELAKHGAKEADLSDWMSLETRHRNIVSVFGTDEVTVPTYEEARYDLIGFFARLVGADSARLPADRSRRNPSMKLEAMRVLHLYNASEPGPRRGEVLEAAYWRFVFSMFELFGDGTRIDPRHFRHLIADGDYDYLQQALGITYDRLPPGAPPADLAARDPWILDRLNWFLATKSLPASPTLRVAIATLHAYFVAAELAERGALAG